MEAFYSRVSHDGAVRLEREVDNWRAAIELSHQSADRELAAQLCGAPTSVLLLSHPHLATAVIRLDSLLARDDQRRVAIATAHGSRAMTTLSDDDMVGSRSSWPVRSLGET
jgi:hypothetical protein